MRDIPMSFTGVLMEEPVLQRTGAGTAFVHFFVRHIPTYWDPVSENWVDAEPNDINCVAEKDAAELIVDFTEGRRGVYVMVDGVFRSRRTYDDDGNIVDAISELLVHDFGPSLLRNA